VHTRSEVRRKKGRDNVVAEIKKAQNLGVPGRAYRLFCKNGEYKGSERQYFGGSHLRWGIG
jgi:hypothetical protein